jgi:pyrroloquinoline quinone biosynthesis protein D
MSEADRMAPAAVFELERQFRFQWEAAQDCYVLLYPEGMVQLKGGAGEIMKRIDGKASVDDVVKDLQNTFPGTDLRQDVIEFLEAAHAKGWIRTKQDQ